MILGVFCFGFRWVSLAEYILILRVYSLLLQMTFFIRASVSIVSTRRVMKCNTPGVCHQLSNGFELKHDMSSGDEGVKIKSTRVSSNLNLSNTPLLAYWPF